MSNRTRLALTILIILSTPLMVVGDTLHLKNGATFEGKLVREEGDTVHFRVKGMGVQKFNRSQILKIVSGHSVDDEYDQRRAKLDPGDAEGLHQLGLWCKQQALRKEAEKCFRAALAADKNHPGTRRELGLPVSFDGKAVEEWVAEIEAADEDRRESILTKQVAAGEEAIPLLLALLKTKSFVSRNLATRHLVSYGPKVADRVVAELRAAKEPWTYGNVLGGLGSAVLPQVEALLDSEDRDVVLTAIVALRRIGPEAVSTLPRLESILGDPELRDAVFEALTFMGEPALPTLLRALECDDPETRATAAYTLASLGSKAARAVNPLIQAIQDEDQSVRWSAVRALGEIGSAARGAVPALIAALEDEDLMVPGSAADALGKIGPDARAAIPALTKRIRKTADTHAAMALAGIGPEAVPALVSVLGDMSIVFLTRFEAAEALGSMGESALSAVPALEQALNDRDALVQGAATRALARIRGSGTDGGAAGQMRSGEGAPPTPSYDGKSVDQWAEWLGSQGDTMWQLYSKDLIEGGASAVPVLLAILGDARQSSRIRGRAAHTLSSIGAPAAPGLMEFARAKHHRLSARAIAAQFAHALESEGSEEALTVLSGIIGEMMASNFGEVRAAAMAGLMEFGPDTVKLLPHLIAGTRDPVAAVRHCALLIIGGLGESAADAAEALAACLDGTDRETIELALLSLGMIGPRARVALPAIRRIVKKDKDSLLTVLAQSLIREFE